MRVAVLISGGGTTLRNFLEKKAAGELDVDFALVISSNPKARGLQIAAEADIPMANCYSLAGSYYNFAITRYDDIIGDADKNDPGSLISRIIKAHNDFLESIAGQGQGGEGY